PLTAENSETTDQNLTNTTQAQTASITYDQVVQADPLVKNLRAYLESYGSPLAEYADQIVLEPQWQRALAISWGESNYGLHCQDNNCSGIGGAPHMKSWRKYETKLDWFKDMSALLEKPIYKERFTNCRSMNGVYNAGSASWVNSCEQKSAELIALTERSEQERLALVNSSQAVASAATQISLK